MHQTSPPGLVGRAIVPVLGLLSAFLLGGVVIVLTDFDHLSTFGTDPAGAIGAAIWATLEAYGALFSGALVDPARVSAALQSGTARDIALAIRPLSEALVAATPIIFVCLGLAISFQAGLFNLGVAGQYLMGGLGATVTAAFIGGLLPPFALLVAAIIGGTLFGAAYGFVPGYLKARTGAHEVITTLMLNFCTPAVIFIVFATVPFFGPPVEMPRVPLLTDLPTTRADWGIVVAIGMAGVVSWLLYRTTLGFELRAMGFSRTAARYAGVRPTATVALAMTLSGGFAGMAGAFVSFGPAGHMSAPYDIGYEGLALAIIGGLRPGRIVVVGLVYGALTNGAKTMQLQSGIPLDLLLVIVGFAMTFVAAPGLVRSLWRIRAPEPVPASVGT